VRVLTHLGRRVRHPVGRSRPREAVVLSGGGCLGAAQVGALQELFAAGIRPDLLVGCSVGALNAAALAVDPTPERLGALEDFWRGLTGRDVFGGAVPALGHLVRRDAHLYDPHALHALIRRWVPVRDLAETAVPLEVATTDLLTGTTCWWSSGDPVTVLSASACLPAVFPPVALNGSLHVDGGVTVPVPLSRAVELGAARVWVLDVTGGTIGRRDDRMTALDVLLLSFAISRQRLADEAGMPVGRRAATRVVRLPALDVGRLEMRDFSQTDRLIRLGRAAARAALVGQRQAGPVPPAQRASPSSLLSLATPSTRSSSPRA